jgi:DNA polymerase-3 subunit beta
MMNMQFTCTKENLSYALNLVSSVAGKQSNLPILSNVMLVANDSSVELSATNLEIGVKAHLRAKVDAPGSFTVPAKTLADFVALMSGDQVQVTQKENELVIESGRSNTKIKGTLAEEFPVIPEFSEGKSFSIERSRLKNGLAQVVFAASKTEIRPELSGIYFGFGVYGYQGLTLAATDSYRLAEKRLPVAQGGDEVTCIVPSRTVSEFIRLMSLSEGSDEKETNVRFFVGDSQVALRYGSFEITSRLIAGRYPDYRQIVPSEFKTTALFSKSQMVSSVKAASLFAATGVNAVNIKLNPSAQSVVVNSASSQAGAYETALDIQGEGIENSIVLNYRYFLDGMSHFDGDEVVISMNSGDAPSLLRAKDDKDYLYLVMPIRQ